MITSIRLVNFKNFADETLRVGPFTVIVGANASGKSNIRDAFRFLHGIGRGYTLAEIFGGKREAGWQPIRGAMNEIVRFGQQAFSLEVKAGSGRTGIGRKESCTIQLRSDATRKPGRSVCARKYYGTSRGPSTPVTRYKKIQGRLLPRYIGLPISRGITFTTETESALTETLSLGKIRDREKLPSYQKINILRNISTLDLHAFSGTVTGAHAGTGFPRGH